MLISDIAINTSSEQNPEAKPKVWMIEMGEVNKNRARVARSKEKRIREGIKRMK